MKERKKIITKEMITTKKKKKKKIPVDGQKKEISSPISISLTAITFMEETSNLTEGLQE